MYDIIVNAIPDVIRIDSFLDQLSIAPGSPGKCVAWLNKGKGFFEGFRLFAERYKSARQM